jgi:hypothetical protein
MTSGNFDMTDDRVTSPDRRDLLHHLSLAAMIPGISVIVRQTTTNIDAGAGLPWKNVMGFWCAHGKVKRIPPRGVESAYGGPQRLVRYV